MSLPVITFENFGASAQANVPQTFAYVFAKGDLPAGSNVSLVATGSTLPCQLDTYSTYADGSIKHASITAIIPALAAGASITYQITLAASAAAGTAPTPASFPGLTASASIVDYGTDAAGPNTGTAYTADASARLAAGTYKTHRSGALMAEWVVRVPFVTSAGVEHPHLHARFEIMAYKGQTRARVHCQVENTWAKPKAAPSGAGTSVWEDVSNIPCIYSYSLSVAGTVVETRSINGFHRVNFTANSAGTYSGNGTRLPNDSTAYTAAIIVDGVRKNISVVGSAVQTYGQLYAAINTQLGGAGTANTDDSNLGIKISSATKGPGSSVVIEYGTLFPALGQGSTWRPIRGNEYIHYPATWWRKTFWWGTAPTLHAKHDRAYVIASFAVPNYPLSLVGDAAKIASNLAAMKANEDIGKNGITKAFMGDTGYAPGIGVLPEWQAMYIINQGLDAKYVMLKQADLQGSWPMHTREYNTGEPINFATWPYATWSPNAGDSRNSATGFNERLPQLAIPSSVPSNANKPDVAHHPDFSFVPFMVTGDYCYMDALATHYAFTVLNLNAASTYRDGRKGLWIAEGQTRGKAWTIRTQAHARFLLPDNHPSRPDLEYITAQNIAYMNANYVDPNGAKYNIFGDFGGYLYSRSGQANNSNAPWQEDHATSAVGRAVELGFSEFLPLLAYKSKQVKGRMTSGAAFCWQLASNYTLQYRDTATSPLYTSWGEVYSKGFSSAITSLACGSPEMGAYLDTTESPLIKQNDMVGAPTDPGGFVANMQPAIAYCATFDMPGGDDAWLIYANRNQKQDYNTAPQFSIEPRALTFAPALPIIDAYRSSAGRLGGALTELPTGTQLFDPITVSASAVVTKYRFEYIRNNDPYATIYDAVLWITDTASAETTVRAGLGASGKRGVEPVLADENIAPVGVTFKAATNKATGVALGNLAPGDWIGVWYECKVNVGAQANRDDTFTRTVEGYSK